MATATENSDIAVLKSEMGSVKETVARIESKLDAQAGVYVTQVEFAEFKKRWFLSHTMAAGAGAVITYVIVYILTHGHGG